MLLLDEPTSGISAGEKFPLMDLVMEAVAAEEAAVLFIEHDMELVERYAARVIAFYEGRIIADGPRSGARGCRRAPLRGRGRVAPPGGRRPRMSAMLDISGLSVAIAGAPVLNDVGFRSRRARSSDWSAATAPARPR